MIRKKRIMYEEDLHIIFFRYPYLIIDDPASIINTIHEYKLDSTSIPDIYIETNNEKYYCEVKLGKLKEKDLYQAIRYFNIISVLSEKNKIRDEKEFSVILIGMHISNQLENKAEKHNIRVKIIGRNILESIKICKNCRKAYDFKELRCKFCNSEELLEIINLKYP